MKDLLKLYKGYEAVYLDTLLFTGSTYLAELAAEEWLANKKKKERTNESNDPGKPALEGSG